MAKRVTRKIIRRGKSAPVRFTDAEIIEASSKPPFPNEQGSYAEPNVVIPGGEEPADLPKELLCGKGIVIYSSWADWVPNCGAFGGPGGGFNAVTQTALVNAYKAAAKIKCLGKCEKFVVELWRGWDCTPEGAKFIAIGAVEVLVRCGPGALPDVEL